MKIKFWSYRQDYNQNKKKILKLCNAVFDSGNLILGKNVETFEKNFSNFINSKFSIGVNSGTDALLISLLALGIKKGDEVITTSNTAIPTVSAIVSSGAKPVFIDIKENDFLINEDKILEKINKKTKAIIIVNLYGQSPNLNLILNIANKKKIKIIEDCAQSFGSKYKSKYTGTFGHLAAFSFYPTKVLGAYGDSGMIVTNNKELYLKVKSLRQYGMTKHYYSNFHGINSRIDELHAAILNFKLKKIKEKIKKRREIANFYNLNINNKKIIKPKENKWSKHVYYNYVIRCENRNKLIKFLNNNNIENKICYPYPIHLMKGYKKYHNKNNNLTITEKLSKEILSLPNYPEIKKNYLKKIVKVLNKF